MEQSSAFIICQAAGWDWDELIIFDIKYVSTKQQCLMDHLESITGNFPYPVDCRCAELIIRIESDS